MTLKQSEQYYSEGYVAGEYAAPITANPYTGPAAELWETGRQRAIIDYEIPEEPWIDDDDAFHVIFWLVLAVAVIAVSGAGVFVGGSL